MPLYFIAFDHSPSQLTVTRNITFPGVGSMSSLYASYMICNIDMFTLNDHCRIDTFITKLYEIWQLLYCKNLPQSFGLVHIQNIVPDILNHILLISLFLLSCPPPPLTVKGSKLYITLARQDLKEIIIYSQ